MSCWAAGCALDLGVVTQTFLCVKIIDLALKSAFLYICIYYIEVYIQKKILIKILIL